MSFKYARLRGRIRTFYVTQAVFARSMGLSECVLSQKLNGRSEWAADEIRKACELLDIPAEEIHLYFFCPRC